MQQAINWYKCSCDWQSVLPFSYWWKIRHAYKNLVRKHSESICMVNLQHRKNKWNILIFFITSTFMFRQYSCTKPLWTTISDCKYRCSLLGIEMKLKEEMKRTAWHQIYSNSGQLWCLWKVILFCRINYKLLWNYYVLFYVLSQVSLLSWWNDSKSLNMAVSRMSIWL